MKSLAIAAGSTALLLAGCATAPNMQRARLDVTMTALQEVPGPGDRDGSGTAEVRLDPQNGRLCWDVYARGIDPAIAAHIHRGAAGSAGPPVVTLTTPDAQGRSSGCAAVDPTLLQEMAARSYEFYLNVHTEPFPNGAIRGQLRGSPLRGQRQRLG